MSNISQTRNIISAFLLSRSCQAKGIFKDSAYSVSLIAFCIIILSLPLFLFLFICLCEPLAFLETHKLRSRQWLIEMRAPYLTASIYSRCISSYVGISYSTEGFLHYNRSLFRRRRWTSQP